MTNTSVKYSTFIASINSAHCFPSAAKKADVCIYQASTNPPQYKVISRQHWQFVMHAHCSTTLSNVPAHSLYWNDKIYIMQVLLKDVCVELPQVHKIAVLCRIFRECSYLSRHSLDNSSITVNIHSFINREIKGKNRGEWKGRQSPGMQDTWLVQPVLCHLATTTRQPDNHQSIPGDCWPFHFSLFSPRKHLISLYSKLRQEF